MTVPAAAGYLMLNAGDGPEIHRAGMAPRRTACGLPALTYDDERGNVEPGQRAFMLVQDETGRPIVREPLPVCGACERITNRR